MLESVSLGIPGHSIPAGTHVCAFYSGPDERDELVLPYLAEGIRTRQKCMAIVDGAIHENPYYIDPGSFLGAGGLAGDGRLAWR